MQLLNVFGVVMSSISSLKQTSISCAKLEITMKEKKTYRRGAGSSHACVRYKPDVRRASMQIEVSVLSVSSREKKRRYLYYTHTRATYHNRERANRPNRQASRVGYRAAVCRRKGRDDCRQQSSIVVVAASDANCQLASYGSTYCRPD